MFSLQILQKSVFKINVNLTFKKNPRRNLSTTSEMQSAENINIDLCTSNLCISSQSLECVNNKEVDNIIIVNKYTNDLKVMSNKDNNADTNHDLKSTFVSR